MSRNIAWNLQIDWGSGVYTDESSYLVGASGSLRLLAPEEIITGGRGIVGQCTLTLHNPNGRFSPSNPDGAYYEYWQSGKAHGAPMFLEVSLDGGANLYRVFTGNLKTPRDVLPTWKDPASIRFDCRDLGDLLLLEKPETLLWQGMTESELIERFLLDAGVSNSLLMLDKGQFIIPFAWIDKESLWEECQALAGACAGRLYVDASGIIHYENAGHWTQLQSNHTTPQVTLYQDSGSILHGVSELVDGIEPVYDDHELASTITVEIQQRALLNTDVIWEPDSPIAVPAGGNKTVTAKLQQAASEVRDLRRGTDYVAVTSGGMDISSYVTASVIRLAQRVHIQLTNAHPTQNAYLLKCQLRGRALYGRPTEDIEVNSTDDWWNGKSARDRAIRGNLYVQTEGQALFLAHMMSDRMQRPRMAYTVRGVPGNPARELGDLVHLVAPAAGIDRNAFLMGIEWQLTSAGFVQTYSCADSEGMYPQNIYFTLGMSALGDGRHIDNAPIFY